MRDVLLYKNGHAATLFRINPDVVATPHYSRLAFTSPRPPRRILLSPELKVSRVPSGVVILTRSLGVKTWVSGFALSALSSAASPSRRRRSWQRVSSAERASFNAYAAPR